MRTISLSSDESCAISQRDRAYQLLRRLLILQQVRAGERLREPAWARQLGVNRMALREAFARLEAEGLIERGPKTGYLVPRLMEEDIREILEIRVVLEVAAVERIVRLKRNSRQRLKPMLEAIDQLQSMIDDGYLLGAIEADHRFHEQLVLLSGSRRLSMIYARAPLPMIHGPTFHTPQWEPEMRRTLAEHRQLLSLLAKGDASKAEKVLRSHLSDRHLKTDAPQSFQLSI